MYVENQNILVPDWGNPAPLESIPERHRTHCESLSLNADPVGLGRIHPVDLSLSRNVQTLPDRG